MLVTFPAGSEPATGLYIVVQLKKLRWWVSMAATEAEKAYGQVVEDNYGRLFVYNFTRCYKQLYGWLCR